MPEEPRICICHNSGRGSQRYRVFNLSCPIESHRNQAGLSEWNPEPKQESAQLRSVFQFKLPEAPPPDDPNEPDWDWVAQFPGG